MSSHREAPEVASDPAIDSSDLYAFVSPDVPDFVTLIANYVPMQNPAGGPNFYEFGNDVRYEIHIDNDGDGKANITYRFTFAVVNNSPLSFLYNTGPITELTKPGVGHSPWNRQQTYTLTRIDTTRAGRSTETVLGRELLCPPCNIGPLSTPNYEATLGAKAIHHFSRNGHTGHVFAGQRADSFFVDLGSIFDLADLRPFEQLHAGSTLSSSAGVNSQAALNVHTLALQVPITNLTHNGKVPVSMTGPEAVIGVWTTASRQKMQVLAGKRGKRVASGPWTQLSRLGNPLVNELLIAISDKDYWNTQPPTSDGSTFFTFFADPKLASMLPGLYPSVFPNLEAYNRAHRGTTTRSPARPDLVAILLTGVPNGKIAQGFATNVGSKAHADLLRLNVAIPPSSNPDILGPLGGDNAGYPNGRRVFDDVVAILLRAMAGATIPAYDSAYTPDPAAGAVTDGLTPSSTSGYLTVFPYVNTPFSGYATPADGHVGSPG
jgi:hypothetical protein